MVHKVTRRRVLRTSAGAALGLTGAAVLAACGETQVVTKEVAVERTVVKEVPVETIVTQTQIKEVPIEKVVMQTQIKEVPIDRVVTREVQVEKLVPKVVEVEKVVERVVEKIVEAAPQRPPITLQISSDWTSGIRKETFEYMKEEYEKLNPNTTIDLLFLGGGGGSTYVGYVAIVTNLMVAGSGPDVMAEVWFKPEQFHLDLTPYLAKAGLSKDDFWWIPDYLEDANGAIRALPFGTYTSAFVANLNVVDAAGAELPSKGYGFPELRETAQRLRDPEGDVWGFERGSGPGWYGWADIMAGEGAQWYDTATESSTLQVATVANGDSVEAFGDWWGLVYRDGVAPRPEDEAAVMTSPSNAGGPGARLFATGLIGISGMSTGHGGAWNSRIGDRFTWHMMWPPESSYSGRRGYSCDATNISAGAVAETRGHAEQAVDLALFWHSETMTEFISANMPNVPPRKSAWSSPTATGFASGYEILPDLAAEAEKTGQFRETWMGGNNSHENWPSYWRAVRGKLEDRALKGGEDPSLMMAEADEAGTGALRTGS